MKKMCALSVSLLLLLLSAQSAKAWTNVVYVFCDANTNGLLDADDTPVQGVTVVVTNLGGTFINSGVTGSDGGVLLPLPVMPDSYVDYLDANSLPVGTTEVLPPFIPFNTTSTDFLVTNTFLIENTNCVVPQPPMTNDCWLTGGGTIGESKQKPDFSFGGVVYPGCKAVSGGGNWNIIDHVNKLHFQAKSIVVVQCGNLPEFPAGSSSPKTPFNFIDFAGTGTLKGIAGNKANYGTVNFYARAVDLGEGKGKGKGQGTDTLIDKFYIQVYTDTGETLLVISSNTSNPAIAAPVTLRSGNLQLHVSGCDKPRSSTHSKKPHAAGHSK